MEEVSETEAPGTRRDAGAAWGTCYLEALRPFYHAVATLEELDGLGLDDYGTPQVLGKELLGRRVVPTSTSRTRR